MFSYDCHDMLRKSRKIFFLSDEAGTGVSRVWKLDCARSNNNCNLILALYKKAK